MVWTVWVSWAEGWVAAVGRAKAPSWDSTRRCPGRSWWRCYYCCCCWGCACYCCCCGWRRRLASPWTADAAAAGWAGWRTALAPPPPPRTRCCSWSGRPSRSSPAPTCPTRRCACRNPRRRRPHFCSTAAQPCSCNTQDSFLLTKESILSFYIDFIQKNIISYTWPLNNLEASESDKKYFFQTLHTKSIKFNFCSKIFIDIYEKDIDL